MEGSGSGSRRGRVGFHSRRELAEYEHGNRPRVSARLSPLLVAAILVAAFVFPAPCSSSSSSSSVVLVAHVCEVPERSKKPARPDEDCDLGKCKCCSAGKGRCLKDGKAHKCNCTSPPETSSWNPPSPSTRPPPPPASSAPSPHPGTRKLAVTTGWSFLCFALLLQVALGGFLVYRRWELQRLGLWQN